MAVVYVSNIVINTGSEFSQVFNLESSDSNTPLNLSSYDVKSQLRKYPNSSSYVEFQSTILDAVSGAIQIKLPADVYLKPGRYVYDIIIIEGLTSSRTRVVEGMALVREGVTK